MFTRTPDRRGFTLIELIIFTAIFSAVFASIVAIFITVTRIQTSQGNAVNINQESRFLVDTIRRYVRESSLIEIPVDVTTSTLKLRMSTSSGDPVYISWDKDSGAVFIQAAGTWKLAGINFAVDGPYNLSGSGPGFSASIFDDGGLYRGGEGNWQLSAALTSGSVVIWDRTGTGVNVGVGSTLTSVPTDASRNSMDVDGSDGDVTNIGTYITTTTSADNIKTNSTSSRRSISRKI